MRKAIGFIIIAISVGLGLFLHDKYMNLLIEQEKSAAPKPRYLEFLNDQILPDVWPGDSVKVGGLSGLAWSELNQSLYAVSDDRGGRAGPSRFYELKLSKNDLEQIEVQVQKVNYIKTKENKIFPDRSMDPEGIAVDKSGWIYISSEGDFEKNKSAVPALLKVNASGQLVQRYNFPMPWFSKDQKDWNENNGIRKNLAFESLDINLNENQLVTTTESALIQDGEKSTIHAGTPVRFSFNDLSEEEFVRETAQFVYPLSAIPSKAISPISVIGVADLILFKNKKVLVLERAYLVGRSKNRVKLFLADCANATDVRELQSLKQVSYTACEKTELYDFDNLVGVLSEAHPRVDNIEGMTLGPQLEDGSRLLIFVSDNNFSPLQRTQFLFFKLKKHPKLSL